jgi:hypothetical protein
MRKKPLNNNPNSMHMIMENFRRFADEIETNDIVYLFEGNKALKQAIKLVVRAVKTLSKVAPKKKSVKERKRLNELTKGQQLQAQIWIKCMQAIKMFMVGAAKASKFLGPPMIMLGGALLLLVLMGGTAAAATSGMPPDPELMSAASDILQQTMEAMGESGIPGGEHASDVERVTDTMVQTSIDGEVVTSINDQVFERSTSIVNKRVQALDAIVSALNKKISSGGDAMDLSQIYAELTPEVQEEVNLAMEAAQELKETDPGAYQEAVEAGRTIDVLWDGEVKSIIDDVSIVQQKTDATGATTDTFQHTVSKSQSAGQSYGARGVQESRKKISKHL